MAILGFLVILGLLRTEDPFRMPSSMGEQAVSYAVWGMKPSNLLMALPMGAFLVVLGRSFVGLKAFGLFTPMLIAIAFLQIGPVFGPIVLISAIAVGMVSAPSLLKLRMTRVGFLGVLISFVVLVLAALQVLLDRDLQVDAFPVVVTALCVERWWRQWEKDGAWPAAHMAINTLVMALVIQFVMVSHVALTLIEISPLVLPAFCGVAIALLGRYRGLRLSEIKRFAPIWLEGRRNARVRTALEAGIQPGADQRQQEPASGIPQAVVFPLPTFGSERANPLARSGEHRRNPWDQSAQRDHREIQPADRNRTGSRQGGGQGGFERWRSRNYRHNLRGLQLWGSG